MPKSLLTLAGHALRVAITLVPWLISMYTLYWLEHVEIWNTDTAHRGKISVLILTTGMLTSFFAYSHLEKRRNK
jgi:hypothetical protein